MTSHAPPVQPALVPHQVNRGLGLLLTVVVLVPLALVALAIGSQTINAPQTSAAFDEYAIALRQAERASLYRVVVDTRTPTIYYTASSALSGVHGPLVLAKPSIYYSASSALSGVQVDPQVMDR